MSGNTPPKIELAGTGLRVSRLCLAAGYATDPRTVPAALEAGINFFYWGSIRRPSFGGELAKVATGARDDIVLAVQSYSRSAALLDLSLTRALRTLGTDRADVLILGYWSGGVPGRILEHAIRLRDAGRVRAICVSTHDPAWFFSAEGIAEGAAEVDILMLRYSAADRSGSEAFLSDPRLSPRPAVISFTSTYWGRLLEPSNMPGAEPAPSAADCYRFALSNPGVDVALCGAANPQQVAEAAAALHAPAMSDEEANRMRRIGDHVLRNSRPLFYRF